MLEWVENLIMLSIIGVPIVFLIILILLIVWLAWNVVSVVVDVVETLIDGRIKNPIATKIIRIITRIVAMPFFPIIAIIVYL